MDTCSYLLQGIVFLGDGCWGVKPEEIRQVEDTPYMVMAESRNHVYYITADQSGMSFTAVDTNGLTFDYWAVSKPITF